MSTNVRFGSTYETAGSFPVLQSLKNCEVVSRDRVVLLVPEEQEADVAAVVAAAQTPFAASRSQIVGRSTRVNESSSRSVTPEWSVDPVRERRAEDRREVAVAHRPRRRGLRRRTADPAAGSSRSGRGHRRSGAASRRRRRCSTRRGHPRTSGRDRGARSPGSRARAGTSGAGRPARRGTSAPPASRPLPAASRGDGRTSGSPSSRRRRGRSRSAPASAAPPGRRRPRGRACRQRPGARERARGGRGGRDEAAPRERPFPPGGHGRDDSPSRG